MSQLSGGGDPYPFLDSLSEPTPDPAPAPPRIVEPLYDRILVRRKPKSEQTSTGIFKPDEAQEEPSEGVVIAVGQGRILESGELRALCLKPGDEVLFGTYAGAPITLSEDENERLLILREDEVLGIVRGVVREQS